jgi:ferredoxin-NADP reductase
MLSFAVKIPSPCSSYKQKLMQLEQGAAITISQAMGDLVLPRDVSRPLIFVAGGLGIASFVGMMRWLTEHNQTRPLQLLYAARSQQNLLFDEVIDGCPGLDPVRIISPTRIDCTRILGSDRPSSLIYLSGSEPFVMNLRLQLLAAGKNPTDIVFDFFDGYKQTDF